MGRELGAFAEQGLELRIVREETAGPEGARGLVSGEYQFAELGCVPIIQAAIEGHDPLILLAAEPVSALYILGRAAITSPRALVGGSIGVLSGKGQTGFSAMQMIERWGLAGNVQLVPLGTYPKIFEALITDKIESGVLTADYKLAGELAHGLTELADLGEEFKYQGPVLATTKRLRDRAPDLIARVVAAYVRSIRLFKTAPQRVVPVLRRHLGFVDEAQARAIQRFYAARFQDAPFASSEGIARVIRSLAGQYPAALQIEPGDVYDSSFLNASIANVV